MFHNVTTSAEVENSNELSKPYCSCESEYCVCGSSLGVTETSALNVYRHLRFPAGRDALLKANYRLSVLHVWGTHNLSTEDLLSWLDDYSPVNLEWINDASCNVVLPDETTALRVILDFAEPFDRRVALAAAAALVTVIEARQSELGQPINGDEETLKSSVSTVSSLCDSVDAVDEFSQYLPPSGRWYKALSVPAKAISLFLRFASIKDVKLPGAERRSVYYRRFGNPNYGGINGLLNNSYRRRLRGSRAETGSLRHVRILPSDFAEVIAHTYEDMDSDASGITRSQQISSAPAPFKFRGGARTAVSSPGAPATPPKPIRALIAYDDVPQTEEDNHAAFRMVRTGSRREAVDFPVPKSSRQPHKWPRKDRGPPPLRWLDSSPPRSGGGVSNPFTDDNNTRSVTLASEASTWEKDRGGSRSAARRSARSDRREDNRHSQALMTITLLPEEDDEGDARAGAIGAAVPFKFLTGLATADTVYQREIDGEAEEEEDTALQTRRLLASMSMIADAEEQEMSDRRNRPLSQRLGFPGAYRRQGPLTSQQHRGTGRNVWQRLG